VNKSSKGNLVFKNLQFVKGINIIKEVIVINKFIFNVVVFLKEVMYKKRIIIPPTNTKNKK
jgi:hypothetical protein